PFSKIEAKADLSRGILTFADARLGFGLDSGAPDVGSDGEAIIAGTADLLLWIIDLALTSTAADAAGTYHVVGRPSRPAGFTSAEN
ncbi:MAG: hypothetical protein OEU92_02825, partial [Alphaproteobacteria bacterium]|nr:hypothetical protein [Alphaproteobacteria bacterium]